MEIPPDEEWYGRTGGARANERDGKIGEMGGVNLPLSAMDAREEVTGVDGTETDVDDWGRAYSLNGGFGIGAADLAIDEASGRREGDEFGEVSRLQCADTGR